MTAENNQRELLTMVQVQACLGISKAYAYKLIKDRKIPSLRLGERGAIRVRGVDLDAYLAEKVKEDHTYTMAKDKEARA